MARVSSTASVFFLTVMVSFALCHQPELPESLKAFSGGKFTSHQELWAYALVSTCLISAAPFFILFFIPLNNAAEHSALLKVLLSFASGGLLGDAFLHLIPHAISPHDHHDHDHHDNSHHTHDHGHSGHDHSHGGHDHTQDMVIGLWVLAGIFVFLMVEKFVRILKGGESHTHHHLSAKDAKSDEKKFEVVKSKNDSNLRQRKQPNSDGNPDKRSESSHNAVHGTNSNIKVSAYLNLAADFAHNFTDGLAIGASYLAGPGVGVVTTITILLHEVPHEIGDFAILIQSGYPKHKAMMLQLVTAVGAIAGTVCGLLAEGMSTTATNWILPFTAGGFIYIATVSVIPELLENSTVWQSIKELIGLSIGIGMMVLIAVYE